MTPLIKKAVRMVPEPETAMWFDVGQMERWPGGQVPMDVVLNLPFQRMGIVGLDQNGIDFAIWMLQGFENVTVSAISMSQGKYIEPFAYIKTGNEIKFYKKNELINDKSVRPIWLIVCSVLLKLANQPTVAYQPIAKNAYINRARKSKGKSPILFDWRTVNIGLKATKTEPKGGTHASPRLHDRRGHWRTLQSGKKIWVKNCKVGDASKGAVFKDYKIVA